MTTTSSTRAIAEVLVGHSAYDALTAQEQAVDVLRQGVAPGHAPRVRHRRCFRTSQNWPCSTRHRNVNFA